jgi:hypothetical protein
VVIQWSLSYDAYANTAPWGGNQQPRPAVTTMAGLERDGVEIARWTLGADQAQKLSPPPAQARVTGTASGLFVDHAAGSGRRTYVLRVWKGGGPGAVIVSTRTMICEER